MSADRMSRWIGTGANLGVLLGLFILIFEVHQNREMMRAQIRHDLSDGIVQLLMAPANNRQLADILFRAEAGQELNPKELFQYRLRTNALFRYWEDVHYQYRVGLYDRVEFEMQRGAWQAFFTASAPGREYWCEVRTLYSPKFRAEMDGLLAEPKC